MSKFGIYMFNEYQIFQIFFTHKHKHARARLSNTQRVFSDSGNFEACIAIKRLYFSPIYVCEIQILILNKIKT